MKSQLSARLKEFRENQGLSQADLAKVLNATQRTVDRYEKGTKIPHTFIIEFYKKYPDKFFWFLFGSDSHNVAEFKTNSSKETEYKAKYELMQEMYKELEQKYENLLRSSGKKE